MRTYHIIIAVVLIVQLIFSKEILEQKWSGNYYEVNSSPQYQAAMKAIGECSVGDHNRILDIGCGSGKITEEILKRSPNARITAVDASVSMIQAAREKYGKNKHITFEVADAQKLHYKCLFDLVVSFSCAHWVKDKEAFFKGVFESLKPQGDVLMVGCAKTAQDPVLRAMLALREKYPWRSLLADIKPETQYFPLDKAELDNLLSRLGFSSVDIKQEIVPLRFKNKAELANWFLGWLGGIAALSVLPQEKQLFFAQALVEQYTTIVPPAADGSLDYPWAVVVVKAKKPADKKCSLTL